MTGRRCGSAQQIDRDAIWRFLDFLIKHPQGPVSFEGIAAGAEGAEQASCYVVQAVAYGHGSFLPMRLTLFARDLLPVWLNGCNRPKAVILEPAAKPVLGIFLRDRVGE